MKASYNPEDDILWIRWNIDPIEESDEVEPGVILDYDKDGNVVGVEVLRASQKIQHLSCLSVATNPSIKLPRSR